MNPNITPPKEKYLWKFIDLYKLLHMLKSKELYFSCLNDFDDLLEFTSEAFILKLKEVLGIAEIPSTLRNPKIENEFFNEKGREFLFMLEQIKKFRINRFVSCFYTSDYESLAMWHLYSGKQGVAIKYKSESLLEYISTFFSQNLKDKYQLTANYVKYLNLLNKNIYDEFGKPILPNSSFSPFIKDIMYEYENEYRILIFGSNPTDERPIIKINDWNDIDFEIVVFSDLEDWKIKIIQELVRDYGINSSVRKSEIITKKTVDKYKDKFVEENLTKLFIKQ
jgi:hypothetical protein